MKYTILGKEQSISELLVKEGIPSNVTGFLYLCKAVSMAAEDPSRAKHVTKCIYPQIALNENTTSACVEHAIRYAIRSTGETNTGFISKLALRIEVQP